MPLAGEVAIAIWNDITDEKRDGFFEWHPREHVPERLGIPGFLRGRRYRAVGPGVEFFTLYELADASVITSQAYQARLANPTAWSLEVLPGFRNNIRGICDILVNTGHVDGGAILTMRLQSVDETGLQLETAVRQVASEIVEREQLTGMSYLVCNQSMSGTNTALQRGRTITTPDRVLLVEGLNASALEEVSGRLSELVKEWAVVQESATYQLEYHLTGLTSNTSD